MTFNGFNGQKCRQAAFADLVVAGGFELLVETGTCNGETAGYMAEVSGLPVITCEIDPKWYREAVRRTANRRVIVHHEDSRQFLWRLDGEHGGQRIFFYLDAHWGRELPLAEEVWIITEQWREFVILIDDFKVTDDPGYGFDDYGEIGVIGPELVRPVIAPHGLGIFYPKAPSSQETGARRGSGFIASRGAMEELLMASPHLRPAP